MQKGNEQEETKETEKGMLTATFVYFVVHVLGCGRFGCRRDVSRALAGLAVIVRPGPQGFTLGKAS